MSDESESPSDKAESPRVESGPERFEEALEGLETIVAELESGQLGLERSLARYEDGVRLLRHCHSILSDVEKKIEVLTGFSPAGEALTSSFDAEATFDESAVVGKKGTRRKSTARPDAAAESLPPPVPPPGERRLF